MLVMFTIVVTTLVMTGIFSVQLNKQVYSDLAVVADMVSKEMDTYLPIDGIRITLIEKDGRVSYDSEVDISKMENHLDRPEVQSAIETGEGRAMRRSNTLSESIFYYTKLLDNGQILRVGKAYYSVVAVLISAIPLVIITALVLAGICYIVSKYLTADMVKPIEEMVEDLDNIQEDSIYEELIPYTRKIRAQHEQILSAANMRQEFTANVTHELKTPLAAISGYAELMENGMAEPKDIEHFSKGIRKSAERLLTLINDIIQLSQMDSGDVEGMLELVDFAEVARDTVQMLMVGARKSDVTLHYEGVEQAQVRIGKEYAQELTYNLIENAIRYNRPGGEVFVSLVEENGIVHFSVRDTGIGIAKKHQERIFERFYRVDKSRSKELGGTGLGLAIVKHICHLTQGELQLESEVGKGTSIGITWNAKN